MTGVAVRRGLLAVLVLGLVAAVFLLTRPADDTESPAPPDVSADKRDPEVPEALEESTVKATTKTPVAGHAVIHGRVVGRFVTWHPEVAPDCVHLTGEKLLARVRTEKERELSGVEVTAGTDRRVRTDARGNYVLDGLPPGAHEIRVVPPAALPRLHPEHASVRVPVRLIPDEDKWIQFTLQGTPTALAGEVHDSNGLPLAGARVTAEPHPGYSVSRPPPEGRVEAVTDERGRFRLNGLVEAEYREAKRILMRGRQVPGTYMVTAEAKGYTPARIIAPAISPSLEKTIRLLVESGGAREIPTRLSFVQGALKLPPLVLCICSSVGGNVGTDRGDPLPGATVGLVRLDEVPSGDGLLKAGLVLPESVVADDRGAFRLDDVPPGEYRFEVTTEAAGLQRASNPPLTVIPGDRLPGLRIEVEADAKGTIVGTVTDRLTGEPVDECVAVAAGEIHKCSDAVLRLERVPRGEVRIEIRASGYATETLSLEVKGGVENELHAALSRPASVKGTVLLDGAQASGRVAAREANGTGSQWRSSWLYGNYRIYGLKDGTLYEIVVLAKEQESEGVSLSARGWAEARAGDPVSLDFDLRTPDSGIRGSIELRSPLKSWYVAAFEGALPETAPFPSPFAARAAADGSTQSGSFRLPLPPGTYTVCARATGDPKTDDAKVIEEARRVVTVREGKTANVEFAFR